MPEIHGSLDTLCTMIEWREAGSTRLQVVEIGDDVTSDDIIHIQQLLVEHGFTVLVLNDINIMLIERIMHHAQAYAEGHVPLYLVKTAPVAVIYRKATIRPDRITYWRMQIAYTDKVTIEKI